MGKEQNEIYNSISHDDIDEVSNYMEALESWVMSHSEMTTPYRAATSLISLGARILYLHRLDNCSAKQVKDYASRIVGDMIDIWERRGE